MFDDDGGFDIGDPLTYEMLNETAQGGNNRGCLGCCVSMIIAVAVIILIVAVI